MMISLLDVGRFSVQAIYNIALNLPVINRTIIHTCGNNLDIMD